MNPIIYDITLSNNGALFVIADIWITENEGGLDRAIDEAVYLAKESMHMEGDIEYMAHKCL